MPCPGRGGIGGRLGVLNGRRAAPAGFYRAACRPPAPRLGGQRATLGASPGRLRKRRRTDRSPVRTRSPASALDSPEASSELAVARRSRSWSFFLFLTWPPFLTCHCPRRPIKPTQNGCSICPHPLYGGRRWPIQGESLLFLSGKGDGTGDRRTFVPAATGERPWRGASSAQSNTTPRRATRGHGHHDASGGGGTATRGRLGRRGGVSRP